MSGYTFAKDRVYGWNIYRNSVWVGWTAGSKADAQEMARRIEAKRQAEAS